jgi:ribonuclease R
MLTIDDRRTRDMDDAVEVHQTPDGWLVVVGISDVSRVVTPGSDFDVEAKGKGWTSYSAVGNRPMLPWELSEKKLSLWPGRDKHVLLVELELTAGLEVKSTKLSLTKIQSEFKLRYDEIPDIIDPEKWLEEDAAALKKHLVLAKELALKLMSKRRDSGAFVFYDINNGWVLTEEGALKQLNERKDTIGYIIIQELMILTNVAVATYCVEHDIPMLFRNHQTKSAAPNREDLMKQIQDAMDTPVLDLGVLQRRTNLLFNKASYGSKLLGHYGLNVPAYLHFTSPIRRYADLIVHQQLRAHLKGEPLPYTGEQIEEIGQYLTDLLKRQQTEKSEAFKERATDRAARQSNAGMIDGLQTKDFERVVKVEVLSGEPPSEALVQTWKRRVGDGSLTSVCQTIVLMHRKPEWQVIHRMTVLGLIEKPMDAVSALAMAQTLGWPEVLYEPSQNGSTFSCKASITIDGAFFGSEVEIAKGGNAKLVKQRAAVALLAAIHGLEEDLPDAIFEAPARATKGYAFDMSKNPISLLNEHSQAMGNMPPRFDCKMAGGEAHAPIVVCTIEYDGHKLSVNGPSKQEAKTAAARKLVELLS